MSTFSIGDEVSLPQGYRAILRWIGRIPGKAAIEYAGVEVIGPDAHKIGKHSGAFQGTQYFQTTEPGTGLFVSYTQLVSTNVRSHKPTFTTIPGSPNVAMPHSPIANFTEIMSPSPRFHKQPGIPDLKTTLNLNKDQDDLVESLNKQIETLTLQHKEDQKKLETNRNQYRDFMRGIEFKIEQMKSKFNSELEQCKTEYEQRLTQTRRANSLLSGSESDVEEQRQALASMQNQLIEERSANEAEIEKLRQDLNESQKIVATVRDLEQMVAELTSSEQANSTKIGDVEKLERELETKTAEIGHLHTVIAERDRRIEYLERVQHVAVEDTLVEPHRELHREPHREPQVDTHTDTNVGTNVDIDDSVLPLPSVSLNKQLEVFDESEISINEDAAAGRTDWCSLCEREGHSAVDCPFE